MSLCCCKKNLFLADNHKEGLQQKMHEKAERIVNSILQTTIDAGIKEAKYRIIAAIESELIEAYLEGYEL